MFEFTSLYSGSTGNSLLIEGKETKILVDAGVSCKKIITALENKKINPEELNGIVITHEHIDHVKSIGLISKKYNIPIYSTEKTWSVLSDQKIKIASNNIKIFDIEKKFLINDLELKAFEISHDAIDPCGFNVFCENKKISVATDLGCITKSVFENLKESSFVLLESNYEKEVLKYSKYPMYLKERINGNKGHLSNDVAGQLVKKLSEYGLKEVMLGHLSKENNFPELAYETVTEKSKNSNVIVSVANRDEITKTIKI